MKQFALLLFLVLAGCAVEDTNLPSTPDVPGRVVCEEPRPEVCAAVYDPVCGSDGKTYSNSCTACAQGVEYSDPGECQ